MSNGQLPNGLSHSDLALFVKYMEEAAESIQAAAKIILYGKESQKHGEGQTNIEKFQEEVGHAQNMLEIMSRPHVNTISWQEVQTSLKAKQVKIWKHLPWQDNNRPKDWAPDGYR